MVVPPLSNIVSLGLKNKGSTQITQPIKALCDLGWIAYFDLLLSFFLPQLNYGFCGGSLQCELLFELLLYV